ncbi:MAG: protein translocase subunit SecF, partial [Vicinamibacterales bacterium]|nr:protein translocase subunit SecF [Vicinamibacterales bacterium]
MQILNNSNIDFIRWRFHAIALSALVLLVGVGLMVSRGGLPMGVDFTGGTIVVVKFQQAVGEDAVRRALDGLPGEKVVQSYGDPSENEVLVRLPQIGEEEGANLEEGARAVVGAIEGAGLGGFEVLSTEIVGPVIGRELQLKGIYATISSLVGILLYIWLRFRLTFAAGAIVATLHDVLVTLAFLSFFGYELSLNLVAAILTITGYSVNDTIVIFDRVRENLRSMRREPLEQVVNLSVNQTLPRTIITSGTTLMAVITLFAFGGEVLKPFAFAMIVGIIAGTYSTVFIAAAIAILLSGKAAAGRAASAVPARAAAGR